jgi:tetratricopeptide (TPR) repeat protein
MTVRELRVGFLLFLLLLFLKTALPLPAQTGGTSSLAAEIGKAEKLPQDPAEKYEALLRLARLLQLSGNLERAAAVWLEAANTAPGSRDDRALLEGCRILIALGEYEKAGEEEPVGGNSRTNSFGARRYHALGALGEFFQQFGFPMAAA